MKTRHAGIVTGSPASCHARDGRVLLTVLVVVGLMVGAVEAGLAQTPASPQAGPFPAMSTFQSGKVTRVSGTTVEIDGRGYDLRPDAEIKTKYGGDIDVSTVRKGALAQFHLKQGTIDKLVITLPE
jgi:hypothetical protein